MTDQLHNLSLQQSTLSQQKETARQTIRTLDRKIQDLQNSLDSISIGDDDLAILKSSIQETVTTISTAQDEFTQKSWDTQISDIEIKISRVDEDIKSIQTELTNTSAQSEFRAKIDVLKNDAAKKSQAQKTLIAANAQKFKAVVGTDLSASTLDSQINVLLRRKTEDLEEAERVADGIAREITQLEAKQNTCKEQLRDKRKEKNEAHAKLIPEVEQEIDEFPGLIKSWEENVLQLREYILR